MDILSNLAMGFGVALSPWTLMLAVIGCFIGTIVGAPPGPWPVERRGAADPDLVLDGA